MKPINDLEDRYRKSIVPWIVACGLSLMLATCVLVIKVASPHFLTEHFGENSLFVALAVAALPFLIVGQIFTPPFKYFHADSAEYCLPGTRIKEMSSDFDLNCRKGEIVEITGHKALVRIRNLDGSRELVEVSAGEIAEGRFKLDTQRVA